MTTETDIHKRFCSVAIGMLIRFEDSISAGIFDANLALGDKEHWIEYKVRRGNTISVRGSQYTWARQRLNVGMKNLWFLVLKENEELPKLYAANGVLAACNPKNLDSKGQMLVDVRGLMHIAHGWKPILRSLFPVDQ